MNLAMFCYKHPGMMRPRSQVRRYSRIGKVYEREANLFAAGLLAPYEKVFDCGTAAEIKARTGISSEASEFRLGELNVESIRIREALKAGLPQHSYSVEQAHPDGIESHIPIVCRAIREAILYSDCDEPLEPLHNNLLGTAVLIVAGAQLLWTAYNRFYPLRQDAELLKAAALTEAALLVQPVRFIDSNGHSTDGLSACNRKCASRIAALVLEIERSEHFAARLPVPNPWGPHDFESSYLKSFVEQGIARLRKGDSISTLSSVLDEAGYREGNYLCHGDIHDLDYLCDILSMLAEVAEDGDSSFHLRHKSDPSTRGAEV